jgi:hypothetical protein
LPISNASMYELPIVWTIAFASPTASDVLSASRLTPTISLPFRSWAVARATCSQRRLIVYVTPLGVGWPATGYQLQSVESPPIRSTGR